MSDEMKELAAMLHSTCQGKSGVSDGSKIDSTQNFCFLNLCLFFCLEILAKGQNKEFPEDQDFKCYIRCLMMETGVVRMILR